MTALPETVPASRWRTRLAESRPAWRSRIEALAARPIDRAAIEALLVEERGGTWRDEPHLRVGLRRLRSLVLAATIDRDLDGRADLGEVVRATTALAETAIAEALEFHARAMDALHGAPVGRGSGAVQDLIVVGMGKLGGGELNVSSDIDLIFVYGEDGDTAATDAVAPGDPPEPRTLRSIPNAEYFTRLGRKLIATLSEIGEDGFVFRVDMRLRPDGDSGPLVVSLAMLENYLVASARDWERFAWIKARIVSPARSAIAADVARDALFRLVTPFVYRRYLDFGAIDALRRLHGQIADEAARREAARRNRSSNGAASRDITTRIDVKLGRGGIREIEFIAQHFQLIRGGRDRALRLQSTLATLAELVREGLLEIEDGERLRDAYVFLRNVEHRLQYLDDAQTHTLPARTALDDCERIGRMCARLFEPAGRDGFDGLVDALEAHRRFVAARFDAVFSQSSGLRDTPGDVADSRALWASLWSGGPQSTRDEASEALLRERLVAIGYAPPDGAFARLTALARSARLRALSSSARTRIDALVPRVVDAAAAQKDPTATLGRWFDLIEAIAGRSAYLALLDEFPPVLRAVTRLLASSPWAAEYLVRHPLLLDDLIVVQQEDRAPRDPTAWQAHWSAVAASLERQLTEVSADAERQMDVLREVHHGEAFQLLIEDLDGRLTIESLSDQLSTLADLILGAAIRHCWAQFVASRVDDALPPEPTFAVIAYGKLGGKELGYVSDLDLVFLFDRRDDAVGPTDPALLVQHYIRFAQRLNLWLTARTTAGTLFEIDLRLRPDGAAGLVVSSLEAWSRYERREHDVGAWVWEHQALTRARFCAGDRRLGDAFEAERVAILGGREPDEAGRAGLRREIVSMRRRMHDGHPNRSGRFDLKHDDGGMVDIEFAVQYLVLAYGAIHRDLLANIGNIALLGVAARVGLIGNIDAGEAADAYRLYRSRQHAVRLADPLAHAARVDAADYLAERSAVRRLWRHLFGPFDERS